MCRPHDSCSAVLDEAFFSWKYLCSPRLVALRRRGLQLVIVGFSIRYRIAAAVQSQGCSFQSLGGRDPVHFQWIGDTTTFLRFVRLLDMLY
jgi:hypothetical protein